MNQISITSPFQLRRWRLDRRWSQQRAAMWYGCGVRMWKYYEEGSHEIPRTLRLRINELHYQERLLTHARDTVLELIVPRGPLSNDPDWRRRLEGLVTLLESGTPDPEALQMAPDRIQASETRDARARGGDQD
jgi:hypothetical protein